jgi:hypothetical protein
MILRKYKYLLGASGDKLTSFSEIPATMSEDGAFIFTISDIDQVAYFSLLQGDSLLKVVLDKYLIEPEDNVTISIRELPKDYYKSNLNDPYFSYIYNAGRLDFKGKGSWKYQCRYETDVSVILTGGAEASSIFMPDFIAHQLNNRTDIALKRCFDLLVKLNSYKKNVCYNILKADFIGKYGSIKCLTATTEFDYYNKRDEAIEFSDNNISDYDNYHVLRATTIEDFMRQIPYGENFERGISDPDANGLHNKDGNGFTDALIEHFEQQQILNNKNVPPMNNDNYDFLVNQLKYTGFGDELNQQLKEKITSQVPEFTLSFQKDYGNDQTVATLQFRKSNESDMYFFNRYALVLKNEQHSDAIKQTFYLGKGEANITLKEGYNLVSGRAVYKDALTNKEQQEYKAWLQVDFKVTDKNGNYKLHPYNEKYGFDLDKALKVYAIKELLDEQTKQRLVESLQRGNRQSVTITIGASDRKLYIEAAPRFKSLNIYNEMGKRLKPEDLREKNSAEQTVTQGSQKQGRKQGGGDDDGEPERGQKQTKRRRQSIS